MSLTHPEASENEQFVGNTPFTGELPEHVRTIESARLGKQAYSINGEELDPNEHRPLIISKTDAVKYNRIMMERFRAAKNGQPMPLT